MAIIIQHPTISKAQRSPSQIKEMPVVDSSFIQNFKYDAQSQQLTVTMKNGGQYIHSDVPSGIWEQLVQAPSKGSLYARVVKGIHPSTRAVDKNVGPPVTKKP